MGNDNRAPRWVWLQATLFGAFGLAAAYAIAIGWHLVFAIVWGPEGF